MAKRTDIKSILILGAGPIVIGQACEFDYSGAQACKALKEEGYRVILVNSNPATIMTDPEMADATYIEPVRWQTVAEIIKKEKPDVILPTMGGQTALNCALDLERHGVLEKFGVEMIGADSEAINKAEDRDLFRTAMQKIGLDMPNSAIAHTLEEALEHKHNVETMRSNLESMAIDENPYIEQIEGLRTTGIQEISFEIMNELTHLQEHQDFLYKLLTSKGFILHRNNKWDDEYIFKNQ